MTTPAGWYPDQSGTTRYWDGQQWTTATAPAAGGPVATGERRFTIHYGFALLAVLALLGTVLPILFMWIGAANSGDEDVAGAVGGFTFIWGAWGMMWTLIWTAFAINHTLKSRR